MYSRTRVSFIRISLALALIFVIGIAIGCSGPPVAVFQASAISGQAPLTVTFTNQSKNANEFTWDFGDGETQATDKVKEVATHRYTKAGTNTVTLTATKKGEPPQTNSVTATVTVSPGSLSKLVLNTADVTLQPEGKQSFTAEAKDEFGNAIPDLAVVFRSDPTSGQVDSSGTFTAGTKAGTYTTGVTATATQGTATAAATASVTIKPDPLDSTTLAAVEVQAGKTQQLRAETKDKYGNPIADVQLAWTVKDDNAGSVASGGQFTAGLVARTFTNAIEVKATQGDLVRTANATVSITPGPLEQVVVGPGQVELGMGMTQQFVAVGADQYGNRISGLTFNWSVEAGGGSIDSKGMFTASATPGTYNKTVKATAKQGEISRSDQANVIIKPDVTPPIILSVSVSAITDSSAILQWETDEPTTSRVEYGTTAVYGSLGAADEKLATSHNLVVKGLTPDTTYHFQVKSVDKSGNTSVSKDATFRTKAIAEFISSSMYSAITIGIYVHQLGFDLFNGSTQRIKVIRVEFFDRSGATTHTISEGRIAEIWETGDVEPGKSFSGSLSFRIPYSTEEIEGWQVKWYCLDAQGVNFIAVGHYSSLGG